MKYLSTYRVHILVVINVLFWGLWIGNDSLEYWDKAYFYERMEILRERGEYKSYLESNNKSEIRNTIPVPPKRIEKYTWWFCIYKTLKYFLPFIVLIYANWLYLIPTYLGRKQYKSYAFAVLLLVVLIGQSLVTTTDIFTGSNVLIIEDEIVFQFPTIVEASWSCLLVVLVTTPFYLSYHWFVQQEKITRLKNEQLNTELSFLRSQINPHFFFNTLNNLYALTLEDTQAASQAILKLSELMRYTIYDGNKGLVSIKQEVEYLNNYLHLQAMRMHKTVDVHFEKNISNEQQQIPPLLFLSFLENAFKHGVDSLRKDAFVHIRLKSNSNYLHFQIQNNYNSNSKKIEGGSGLQNVQNRLALLYPEKHQLQIKDETTTFGIDLKIELT